MQIGRGRAPSLSKAREFSLGKRAYGCGMLRWLRYHCLHRVQQGPGSLEVHSSIIKGTLLSPGVC